MKTTKDAPFGKCEACSKEFNSELVNEYNIKFCPYCGQKIDNPDVYEDYTDSETKAVKKPAHYKGTHGIECIEAIRNSMNDEAFCGYLKGCIIKYVWRYTRKGKAVEDLRKASEYVQFLINAEKECANER